MFEFHVSRLSRERYQFDQALFSFNGNVIFTNFLAARQFAQKINQSRDLVNFPEQAISAGDINAIGLIDEILHLVVALYRSTIEPQVMAEVLEILQETLGEKRLQLTLLSFIEEFPPMAVYRGEMRAEEYLAAETVGIPHTQIALEELLMLWITNQNPAVAPFGELFVDTQLSQTTLYRQAIEALGKFFKTKPFFGPDNQDLITMLRSPAIEEPYSLTGQLEYIRRKWGALIGDYLYRLLSSIDLIREETKAVFAGPGPTYVPSFGLLEEENFSPDSDWTVSYTHLRAHET